MVEEQAQHSLKEFEGRLKQAGMAEEEVANKLAEAKSEAHTDAERRVRVFFLLEAVARKEKIFVTEGDMEVSGSSQGAKNFVAGGTMTLAGGVKGALMAVNNPLDFQGSQVEGLAVTNALIKESDEALAPFTINHEPFADAGITVSMAEYPVTVVVEREN